MIADTLALGTVQLGDPRLSEREAERILMTAWDEGIRYYDTAQAYGLSEARLSRYLPSEARIITKLHPYASYEYLVSIETRLRDSLELFPIWGLLLHRERMLERWDRDLGALLYDWRNRGLIQHLGLSLESAESDPFIACDKPELEILQIPAGTADPPPTDYLFVRSLYEHGAVADRQAAIQHARMRFPSATMLIGAESAEHVIDNCRMVERVCA